MSSLPTVMHTRQRSRTLETDPGKSSTPALETKSRFGFSRKSSSRNPSPSPSKPSASPALRGVTPELASDSERPSRTQPSPNPEKTGSMFGFFKRSKDTTPVPPKEKRIRKGPAAGTGHEAYSKFSLRGRGGSTTSGPVVRSSSADSARTHDVPLPSSRKSSIGSQAGSDVDEFVAERLNPITLRGNGPVKASETVGGHRKSGSSTDASLAPSSTSSLLAKGPDSGKPPHDQKSSRFGLSIATKRASRRSLLEPKSAQGQTDLFGNYRFPTHPAINPLERKMSEPSPTEQPPMPAAPRPAKRAETVPKVTPKLTRKWNFFQRAKVPPKEPEKAPEPAVNMSKQTPRRSVAHYALQDASDRIDVHELERIMQEAENTVEQTAEDVAPEEVEPTASRHGNSIILPAPPTIVPEFVANRPASPKVSLQYERIAAPAIEEEQRSYTPVMPPPQSSWPPVMPPPSLPPPEQSPPKTAPRQSRLPQVGRIPRVVSRRDRDRKPSISSFSRPFDSTQPSPAMQSPTFPDGFPAPIGNQDGDGMLQPNPGNFGIQIMGQQPFFALPNSQVLFAPQGNAFAPLLPPAPGQQSPAISVEEVWNEYDDLLDALSAPPKTPHTGSSLGAPFPYMDMLTPMNDNFAHGLLSPPHNAIPSVASIAQKIRFPSVRESQIYGSGHLALTPVSTPSVSDFLLGYGERSPSALDSLNGRMSIPSARHSSSTSRLSLPPPAHRAPRGVARHSQVSSDASQSSKKSRDSVSIQLAEAKQMGFESMANLRFGALMTSKWLSFGRVLFSPVHDELKSPQDDRILIIDGLGKGMCIAKQKKLF